MRSNSSSDGPKVNEEISEEEKELLRALRSAG